MEVKDYYEAPASREIEMKAGRVICESANMNVIYGEENL